jgi:hypothetical protein
MKSPAEELGTPPFLHPAQGRMKGHPDCMQTGMRAKGALIPPEAQRDG